MSRQDNVKSIWISDIRYPKEVPPGKTFTVEVDVENGALFRDAWDPDWPGNENPCSLGDVDGRAPTCVTIEIVTPAQEKRQHKVAVGTEIGTKTTTFGFTLRAPDTEQSFWIDPKLILEGSGKTLDPPSESVEITKGSVDPDPDPDPNKDFIKRALEWLKGETIPSVPNYAIAAAVVLLLVVAI